jgi:hypothetical protein
VQNLHNYCDSVGVVMDIPPGESSSQVRALEPLKRHEIASSTIVLYRLLVPEPHSASDQNH